MPPPSCWSVQHGWVWVRWGLLTRGDGLVPIAVGGLTGVSPNWLAGLFRP